MSTLSIRESLDLIVERHREAVTRRERLRHVERDAPYLTKRKLPGMHERLRPS